MTGLLPSTSPFQRAASASAPISESAPPAPTEDTAFPQGQCRYILMIPQIKGQRCACVTFSHNPSVPGAMCNCGHLACFHLQTSESASPGKNKDEIEVIKQRVGVLEQQSDVGDGGAMDRMVTRLGNLEEMVEKAREEFHAEIKGSYRNISGAWQLLEQLQKQVDTLEGICRTQSRQLDRAGKELDDVRNRQLELLDSDESLEERIEKLESAEILLSPPLEDQPVAATLPHGPPPPPPHSSSSALTAVENLPSSPPDLMLDKTKSSEPSQDPKHVSGSWTLHVSLLPSRNQRRPFDKDSTAYKRSLSRGMQRMVAVDAARGESFAMAVTRTFRHVLQGRPWELLRKAPNASPGGGFHLCPFETRVPHQSVDRAFLRDNCASIDAQGNMEAVYIAPSHGVLPWHQLRQLPVHIEGLEGSWAFDATLDPEATGIKQDPQSSPYRQPASISGGSTATTNHLKRTVSDLSRSTCITSMSAADAEQGRAKIARTCMTAMVGVTTGSERRRAV
ncbi:hypothetical protein NLU13_1633 [Sarocladium strictum]|uniref:Uncharacterized protein n=1 Tax=Sarocladium strictum TaxID=5046 RepID=A0AA39LCJ6_SARSR|nr:hypothetical protein NLU13_1633 [Sarocladium strictum]